MLQSLFQLCILGVLNPVCSQVTARELPGKPPGFGVGAALSSAHQPRGLWFRLKHFSVAEGSKDLLCLEVTRSGQNG